MTILDLFTYSSTFQLLIVCFGCKVENIPLLKKLRICRVMDKTALGSHNLSNSCRKHDLENTKAGLSGCAWGKSKEGFTRIQLELDSEKVVL